MGINAKKFEELRRAGDILEFLTRFDNEAVEGRC